MYLKFFFLLTLIKFSFSNQENINNFYKINCDLRPFTYLNLLEIYLKHQLNNEYLNQTFYEFSQNINFKKIEEICEKKSKFKLTLIEANQKIDEKFSKNNLIKDKISLELLDSILLGKLFGINYKTVSYVFSNSNKNLKNTDYLNQIFKTALKSGIKKTNYVKKYKKKEKNNDEELEKSSVTHNEDNDFEDNEEDHEDYEYEENHKEPIIKDDLDEEEKNYNDKSKLIHKEFLKDHKKMKKRMRKKLKRNYLNKNMKDEKKSVSKRLKRNSLIMSPFEDNEDVWSNQNFFNFHKVNHKHESIKMKKKNNIKRKKENEISNLKKKLQLSKHLKNRMKQKNFNKKKIIYDPNEIEREDKFDFENLKLIRIQRQTRNRKKNSKKKTIHRKKTQKRKPNLKKKSKRKN